MRCLACGAEIVVRTVNGDGWNCYIAGCPECCVFINVDVCQNGEIGVFSNGTGDAFSEVGALAAWEKYSSDIKSKLKEVVA